MKYDVYEEYVDNLRCQLRCLENGPDDLKSLMLPVVSPCENEAMTLQEIKLQVRKLYTSFNEKAAVNNMSVYEAMANLICDKRISVVGQRDGENLYSLYSDREPRDS